uniref:Metallophosphoesterase n=1 Tax=uncultured Acidobacteria bacterium A2 TaxID=1036852 RepID=F8TTG8_9BACT|nr:metallophosphoesterase [uncultured Acidobacteria bacterium A2]
MVSFLHAADVHLGLRVTRFANEVARKIREARFQSLDNILSVAKAGNVDFLLIAGDLFDDHAVDQLTAQRAFEMLASAAVPVYVLPGNHDPYLPGSVWDRPPWDGADTGQVRLLCRAEMVEAAPGVSLFACPLFQKTSLRDPTAWIEPSPNGRQVLRIGIAHGSLNVRANLPEDDHLIAPNVAVEKHLDYLALGHWHRRQLFAGADRVERTAYPGVPEPMRFPESVERTGWQPYSGLRDEFLDAGTGEILHVTIDRPGAAPKIEPIEVGHLVWGEELHALEGNDDLSKLIADIATRARPECRLLRLRLDGILEADAMLRLEELQQMLDGRYLFNEIDESALHVRPTDDEVRAVAGDGVLRRVLDQLQHEAGSGDPVAARRAERCMLLMYRLAREIEA